MALASMSSTKIRTALTLLGIIIGVASVILTVSLGEGIKNDVVRQISSYESSRITIIPGVPFERDESGRVRGVNFSGLIGASTLTDKDIDDLQKVEGIAVAVPFALVTATPTSQNQQPLRGVFVAATTPSAPDALQTDLVKGSFFEEEETNRNLAVIGADVAEAFFQEDEPIGRTISIRGNDFIVRGVFDRFKNGGVHLGLDYNSAILIPLGTARRISDGVVEYREIQVISDEGQNETDLVNRIETTLKNNHANQVDFSVLRQEEFLSITSQLFGIVTTFVAAVAGISLLVGGIGIMNIMLVSVTERTREIGIRKALGASNAQILVQFLVESIVLCLSGGVIGVIVAAGVAGILTVTTDLSPAFTPQVIGLSLLLSTIVGVVFGVTPALKAARKDPITSLRHD